MKTKNLTGFLAAILLLVVGCKKDETAKEAVFVSTSEMTGITSVSAIGGGDVDLVGVQAITERGICWDVNPKPTIDKNKAVAEGNSTGHFTGEITGLTAGTDYFGRAYVVNKGETYYGNEVKFTASTPVELIANGDFELPADPGVTDINALPNWKTDETNTGIIGRGSDDRNPSQYAWTYSSSQSFYQEAGTVPSAASDYAIKFDGNYDWTDWGNGYEATIGVIFSVYDGNDPSTRTPIDTVKIGTGGFPGWGNNWGPREGTYSIPAGSPYAGKNLVIEFDLLPYVDPSNGDLWDDTVWYNFDNISVIQTLK